ncbi:MAG: alpha/beta hydrolase [Pseudomonadota bacterium]
MLDLTERFSFEGHGIAWGRLGAGPPLVMVHGTPFSAQVWRRIAPLMAARRTVYLFDLLGYGQSDMPDGDVSLGVQNRLLAALFAHWGLERPDMLAHDFGGATVLRAYYLDGLRYGRLTLIDPVAVRPWGSPFVTHVRVHEAAFAGMPDYVHAAVLEAYLQTASHRGLDAEAVDVYARPWRGAVGKPAFYRQIAQMDQSYTDEVEGRYGALDCRVTLLWGAEDQWIPLDTGKRVAELLRPDRFHTIPNAGHLVQDDAPEAIVSALLSEAA